MKRFLKSSTLFVVVLLILPTLAHTQDFRHVELNLFLGGSGHTNENYVIGYPQSFTPINGQFKMDSAIRGGARFNVYKTSHWGEEFFFSYEPNKARFTLKTTPEQTQTYSTRVMNFGLNAMYYINEEESRKTRPFLSIGFGGTLYQPTAEAKEQARSPFGGNLPSFASSKELALNYGIGFKRDYRDNYGFRMDLRGFLGRNPDFGLLRSSSNPNEVVFPVSGVIQSVEASAGFIIKLRR
jgi:hypothetical protein